VQLAEDRELLGGILAHNRAVPPAAGWPDVLGAAQRLYERAGSVIGDRRHTPQE
jgi:hypothetical protein